MFCSPRHLNPSFWEWVLRAPEGGLPRREELFSCGTFFPWHRLVMVSALTWDRRSDQMPVVPLAGTPVTRSLRRGCTQGSGWHLLLHCGFSALVFLFFSFCFALPHLSGSFPF